MGTRHIIAVKVDGEYKVAQYGQWDGYPSGQGRSILAFLKSLDAKGLETFKQKCRQLTWISDKELDAMWKAAGADAQGYIGCEDAKKFGDAHPEFSRDTSAGILPIIMERDGLRLQNSIDFVGDSLFCEWGYVIDLDANTFEVFQGFQKSSLNKSDRFYSFTDKSKKKKGEEKYYPIRLQALWNLDNLPESIDLEKLVEEGHIAKTETPAERTARLQAEEVKRKEEDAKKKADEANFKEVVESTADVPVRKFE